MSVFSASSGFPASARNRASTSGSMSPARWRSLNPSPALPAATAARPSNSSVAACTRRTRPGFRAGLPAPTGSVGRQDPGICDVRGKRLDRCQLALTALIVPPGGQRTARRAMAIYLPDRVVRGPCIGPLRPRGQFVPHLELRVEASSNMSRPRSQATVRVSGRQVAGVSRQVDHPSRQREGVSRPCRPSLTP